MAVKIRLARGGTKKRPYFRIVIADIRAPRDGRYIERVGSYNPLLPKDHDDRVKLDIERIKEWLSKGAKPTDRVARFLDAAGILKREPRNNPIKSVPKKPKEEAPAEEAKEEAPAEEAPAEEAKEEPKEEAKEEAPAKKTPAKKATAKKTPAKKATAKKTPAKKATAKKTPAKDK